MTKQAKIERLHGANLSKLTTFLKEELREFIYRKERYDTDFCVAVFIAKVDISELREHIRFSDIFFEIEQGVVVIAFDATDLERGIKATAKLAARLEAKYFNEHFYIAIVSSKEHPDANGQASHLLNILTFELEHDIYNTILSDTDSLAI